MHVKCTQSDIEVLKRILIKLEKGYCSKCHIDDDDSGIIFIADMESEQLQEVRLLKLIINVLEAIKAHHLEKITEVQKKGSKK